MHFIRDYFAHTSPRKMVDLLNSGTAPGSPAAKALIRSTGQARDYRWTLLAALALFGILAIGHFVLAITDFTLGWISKDDAIPVSIRIGAPVYYLAAAQAVLMTGLFVFQKALYKQSCDDWVLPLKDSPKHCKEILDLNEALSGGAVHAVNRPLYMADLEFARELNQKRLSLIAAREDFFSLALPDAEEEAALAKACAQAHSLVKTTPCASS